ncbi:multidrug efflux system subunit MdtC [Salmonella enterica subsp. arizonae]|uniref:Multidrug efflux system subunit MdtC n=1 Tax=Salmonella enterica subsp. arizonae TaxID=59203 RepID=A0A379S303_SALER|nr:multidrug efflux system subunit MdtC [Salmonella enterica subsp. arizonae]
MTSSSSLGSTRIILEFNFDRDINGAARDVQAAINAAQSLLPSGMPSRPTYRKANPVRRADYDFNAHLGQLVTGRTV